ncbi:hypothetical protein CHS0354_026197 [Potamilus streckersoni]|uniref:Uncharacterized protein n=1 Tax=Potamilus streckersoni TaxID=2493646 RepID=A0AAE0VU14_9BIVA|nr:hypothetical protein CHS0354_026197 [Potamilus streckersoni]
MAGEMRDLAKTPIGQAIVNGDVHLLKGLINSGEDVLNKDRKGNTYIHFICTMYRPSVFYNLVNTGIDIHAQNRHGNTALHVTALQNECCHVGDLMACGIDPFIKNKDGKIASELGTQNKVWHMIYEKYKSLFGPNFMEGPGIFQVVKDHDLPSIHRLLHCWCRVDVRKNGQTLRHFAAALGHHDIVGIIDEYQPTMNMIYGVLEGDYEKVEEALKKTRCRVNFLNEVSQRKHILQYAIRFKDKRFVEMLCKAGADVNMQVMVSTYFWGPLYFEAFHHEVPLDILWIVLKSGAIFTLKDERGRTAFMFALDKGNGRIPIEIFEYILGDGGDITDRDCTGLTTRDIARFARRKDVVDMIDKHYIKLIRTSQLSTLQSMVINAYDSFEVFFNYRDTFVYASGNETDDVLKLTQWLPSFQPQVKQLHSAITNFQPVERIKQILEDSDAPQHLINAKDKGLRSPLILAVLHGRENIVAFLLDSGHDVDINAQDSSRRTCLHYAYALTDNSGEIILQYLLEAGAYSTIKDVREQKPEEYSNLPNREEWIVQERKAVYGMDKELTCVDKYEELRKIIRAKKKGLKHFSQATKYFPYPVVDFPKILCPLMQDYRDLLFLAIDYGKEDIAYRMVGLGADIWRKEKYKKKHENDLMEVRYHLPEERAVRLGMIELAAYIARKREVRLKKRKENMTHSHLSPTPKFEMALSAKPCSAIFVTQLER